MKTPVSIVAALFIAGVVASAQGNTKGLLSPGAGTNVESTAVNARGIVQIIESADVPIEPGFSCDRPPSSAEHGGVGITLDRAPDDSMAQGTRMIAHATRAQIQTGQPDSDGHRRVETSVGGAAVFYAETTVPCIGSASPSKKALVLDAFRANGGSH